MQKTIFIPTIFITNWHMHTFILIIIFLACPLFTLCFTLLETSHPPWQYSVLVLGSGDLLSIFLRQSLRSYSLFTNNTSCFWNGCPQSLHHPPPHSQGYFPIKLCKLTFLLCAATWFFYFFIYHLNILCFSLWPWNKESAALDR